MRYLASAGASAIGMAAVAAMGDMGTTILAAGGEGNHIVRYHLESGSVIDHFVADGVSSMQFPFALRLHPDGAIVACGWLSDAVHRFDRETGESLESFIPAGLGGLDGPTDILFHPDGFALVSSNGTNRVRRAWSRPGAR